jgi:hypothetical protein
MRRNSRCQLFLARDAPRGVVRHQRQRAIDITGGEQLEEALCGGLVAIVVHGGCKLPPRSPYRQQTQECMRTIHGTHAPGAEPEQSY